jgi:hypothetical protein
MDPTDADSGPPVRQDPDLLLALEYQIEQGPKTPQMCMIGHRQVAGSDEVPHEEGYPTDAQGMAIGECVTCSREAWL